MIKKTGLFICITLLVGCSGFSSKQAPAPVYGQPDFKHSASEKKNSSVVPKNSATTEVKAIQDPIILKQQEVFVSPQPQPQSSNVVVALLSEADMSYQQGHLDESVVTIERALRIEPRNPLLLYKLAVLRLQQGQAELAENLAKKSELLAVGNTQLKKKNWLLIAEAREQQGKQSAAEEARRKAQHF